jgi:hypothetical protein
VFVTQFLALKLVNDTRPLTQAKAPTTGARDA